MWYDRADDIPTPLWEPGVNGDSGFPPVLTASDGAKGAIDSAILKIWEQLNVDVVSYLSAGNAAAPTFSALS